MMNDSAESSHHIAQRKYKNPTPPKSNSWLITSPLLITVAEPIAKQPTNRLCAGCRIIGEKTCWTSQMIHDGNEWLT